VVHGIRMMTMLAKRREKQKEKKLKEKGEGEALKHPQAVAEEKEKDGVVQVNSEDVGTEQNPNPEGTVDTMKKGVPEEREEEEIRRGGERTERAEASKAEESGAIPVQITRDPESSGHASPTGTTAPRPMDRPTIDPLRIYRRCCQLRETLC